MNPYELMSEWHHCDAPFSIPCPHCDSIATYDKQGNRLCVSQRSYVATEFAGAGPEARGGTIFGRCCCTNHQCQEHTYFIGNFSANCDPDQEPYDEFIIKYFLPSVPLIRMPENTPKPVSMLIERSFGPAFVEQAAAGHLLRSAIEVLLTELKVSRFTISKKGKRVRIKLHDRIEWLPASLQAYKEDLLAIKWIGNSATHEDLCVKDLKLLYEIVERLLNRLYGTKDRELLREIKRINRRKGV